jgi:hypothetical protein
MTTNDGQGEDNIPSASAQRDKPRTDLSVIARELPGWDLLPPETLLVRRRPNK